MLHRPVEDEVQESVDGEVERVDPLPGARPVDFRPPGACDGEESVDGSVGRPANSAMIEEIRPSGFCSVPPMMSPKSMRRSQMRRSRC